MSWATLGTIIPTNQWQYFPVPSLGGELFRFKSQWSTPPYYGLSAYIAQFFYNQDTTDRWVRIWPNPQDKLVRMEIPPELIAEGMVVRYIGVKIRSPFRQGAWNHTWVIQCDEWNGPTLSVDPDLAPIVQGQGDILAAIDQLGDTLQNAPPPNSAAPPPGNGVTLTPGQGQF
jgi:hypothetical protein